MAGIIDTLASTGMKLVAALKDSKKIEQGTFENISKAFGGVQSFTQTVGQTIKKDSPLDAAGGVADKAGDLAMMGGPVGMVAGIALKTAGAALEGIERLRKWDNELINANLSFADVSSGMAAVGAERQMASNRLRFEQGQDRSESTRRLSESTNVLNRQLAPIENWWARTKNDIADAFNKTVSAVLSPVLGDGGEDKSKPRPVTPNEWMADAARQYELKVQRRPKRMR